MAQVLPTTPNALRTNLVKLTYGHFFYVLAYALSIIAFDSWNLIPPEALLQRWTLATVLLIATTGVWYLTRSVASEKVHQLLLFVLVSVDIVVAAVSVYAQRGMASRAVMLFAVPLITIALLRSRLALYATACLCTAAYVLAAVRYFVLHPGEGYKIELYGEIGFYSAMLFLLAALLVVITQAKDPA